MRSKTEEEIADCVRAIEQLGGVQALNRRLEEVDAKIDGMRKMIVRLEDRIMEFETERYTIQRRLTTRKCARCKSVINGQQYSTPFIDGEVFCSRECLLAELTKTIREV